MENFSFTENENSYGFYGIGWKLSNKNIEDIIDFIEKNKKYIYTDILDIFNYEEDIEFEDFINDNYEKLDKYRNLLGGVYNFYIYETILKETYLVYSFDLNGLKWSYCLKEMDSLIYNLKDNLMFNVIEEIVGKEAVWINGTNTLKLK